MAIERQKLQASLPRIGVVNVNTGVEQTYKTIARTSERIANDFAPFAQKRAEDAGINTAKAIAKQNFIDFDNTGSPNPEHDNYNPNFGKPKAFAVPKDFGLVARSAYERVIERRFEESMQEELELKAIELSNDSKDSAEYNQRFTNYLAAMDKAASGRFAEYIQNTGTAILRDSLLKLQIKEQEAAVKYAKKQSKENVFFALRKLSNSVAMADDPESVNEIMTLSRNVTVAIEEDFALNQDKIEYVKNLDQIAFAKAGALTNLLSTSTANLPESERLRIAGALTNPALIKTIDSKITRQRIRSIIKTSNGMNLDKLSESFTKQVDAVDQIQKAEDTEYFSNNENLFNQIITRASFNDLVSSMNIQLDKAPEESKEEVEQLFANAIGNEFISELTSLESVQKLKPKELEIVLNQIQTITNMQGKSTDPNVALELDKIKQVGVRKLVSELINAEETAQKDALDKLGTVINPKAKADKLIQEEAQREIDEKNAVYTADATKRYDELEALYNDAKGQKNDQAMIQLFEKFLSQENEEGIPYYTYLGAEDSSAFNKMAVTYKQVANRIKGKKQTDLITKREKESIDILFAKLRNADGISKANSIKNSLDKRLKFFNGEHSSDYISSKRKEMDTEFAKYVKKDEAAKDLNFKNQAELITKDIRDLQELGEVISEDQVNKALENVTSFLSQDSKGLNKATELDFHNKIKNDYALSVIQPLMNTLREKTGGNGVSPALIKQAADIANTKNTDKFNEFVKELDKDSALYLMAKGLFDASKITTARSEIRTQLGKLLEYNTTQFDQYTKEIQITNDLDAVKRLGSFSKDNQLRTYEDITYTKLAGLPEGTVIDYNNGKLFRTPSGQLTALGQKIFDDMQRGVRVPNLVASLELAASAGVEDGSFLFSIFAQGMNQQPNGTNNNLWVQRGQNQLSPDTVGRFASALILYKVGGTSTPSEALREIIGADQQAGPEGVKGYLKLKLGEDLEEWIADTYPEADFQSSQILKNASLALGRNINDGGELKKILKGFINATYGYDDKVLGTVVDPMSGFFLDSGYIFGSTGKPLVVGARSKYAGTKAHKKMDAAASQLIFENISDIERQRRFEVSTIDAPRLVGKALTGVYFTPMPGFVDKFFFGETEGGGSVVDEVGQMFTHDINFKYRESTQQSGVYYIMMPTVGGGGYQKLTTKEGIPVLIDIFEYEDKPKFHPNLLFYNRDFARALSLDPNGGKFLQYKGLQPIGDDEERILNTDLVNVAPKSSVPLLRAEQALMLMRHPEMLANPFNRSIFKTLVEEKVIRKEDVDFFIPFLEQYN